MESLSKNTRKPDITFYSSGKIDITSYLAKVLDLAPGDVIDVATDDDEFYVYVKYKSPVRGLHSATVFATNPSSHNFRAYSHTLCKAILEECGVRTKARLCVGEPVLHEQTLFVPIITKNLL